MSNKAYKNGDKVEIINNALSGHHYKIGDIVTITDDTMPGSYLTSNGKTTWYVHPDDMQLVGAKKPTAGSEVARKALVFNSANKLLVANNTVTTLEIKNDLRANYPFILWPQHTKNGVMGVSEIMDEYATLNVYTYTDNGTYRTYSSPTIKRVRAIKSPKKAPMATKKVAKPLVVKGTGVAYISRKKALDLMENNKGHFFTAIFSKTDGTLRTMNCQYLKGQVPSKLGYLKVNEVPRLKAKADNPIRQVNMQTLKELSIAGITYRIR